MPSLPSKLNSFCSYSQMYLLVGKIKKKDWYIHDKINMMYRKNVRHKCFSIVSIFYGEHIIFAVVICFLLIGNRFLYSLNIPKVSHVLLQQYLHRL